MNFLDYILLALAAFHLYMLVNIYMARESTVAFYLERDRWMRAVWMNLFVAVGSSGLLAWRLLA